MSITTHPPPPPPPPPPIEQEYTLRRITADDVDAVLTLCRTFWPFSRQDVEMDIAAMRLYALCPRGKPHGLADDVVLPPIVAMAGLVDQGKSVALANVVTHPALHKRGLGAYVIRHTLRQAHAEAQNVVLMSSMGARNLYASLGFVDSEVQVSIFVVEPDVRLVDIEGECGRLKAVLPGYSVYTGLLPASDLDELRRLTAETSGGMDRSTLLEHFLSPTTPSGEAVQVQPYVVIVRDSNAAIVGFAALYGHFGVAFISFSIAPSVEVAQLVIALVASQRDRQHANLRMIFYRIDGQDPDDALGAWLTALGFRDKDVEVDAKTGQPTKALNNPSMELRLRGSSSVLKGYLRSNSDHRPKQFGYTSAASL